MTKTATVHAQQKWEYNEVTRKTETFLLNDLNDAGQHGWEAMTVIHWKDRSGEDRWTAFFKRPFVTHAGADSSRTEAAARQAPPEQNRIEPRQLGT